MDEDDPYNRRGFRCLNIQSVIYPIEVATETGKRISTIAISMLYTS